MKSDTEAPGFDRSILIHAPAMRVLEAFFATKGRESPLGTYDIDEDGDTTLSDYASYKIVGKELKFDKVIKAQSE